MQVLHAERNTLARARLTINLDAVAANWARLDALSGPGVETAAVIKADAYGLGAARVGPRLARAGVRSFFVALAEEGAVLRAAIGPGSRIFVFAGYMEGDAGLFADSDLIPCLNSPAQAAAFTSTHPSRAFAFQLDSGMNRLGMEAAELAGVLDPGGPRPVLLLSHLACADDPDHPMNAAQASAFDAMARRLPGVPRSLAATGGVLLGDRFHHQMTRPGVGLYGGRPFAAARPVVTLALPVIQTRAVAPGEAVGYGAAWTAARPTQVATVAAGYADGLLRHLGAGRALLFAGDRPCPVIGRVSMDLITVDVTGLDAVPPILEILNESQTIDDLAAEAGTIGYEILTALGDRYERVYKG